MQQLKIPAGTSLLIGAPAHPMDAQVSTAIGKLTESIPGILEAHLPQMFAPAVMDAPSQVLVVVLRYGADVKEVTDRLGSGLAQILPEGVHLDVWPIPTGHSMLDDVRTAGCLI